MSVPLDWPPVLATYKVDLRDAGVALDDTRYDAALQYSLDAAVAYVARVRSDAIALPTADLILGTLRYARRLDVRRDTPSGQFIAGQLGTMSVESMDADIDRLLRVGKYGTLRFA